VYLPKSADQLRDANPRDFWLNPISDVQAERSMYFAIDVEGGKPPVSSRHSASRNR
jgi:hypothetical protein